MGRIIVVMLRTRMVMKTIVIRLFFFEKKDSEMVDGENNSGYAKNENGDENNSDKPSKMDDENNTAKATKMGVKTASEDKQATNRKKHSEKDTFVDKELLQVEDLRCILHNLGKFLSHMDVCQGIDTTCSYRKQLSDIHSFKYAR